MHNLWRDAVPSAVPLAEGGSSGREIWTRRSLLLLGQDHVGRNGTPLALLQGQSHRRDKWQLGPANPALCGREKQFVEG